MDEAVKYFAVPEKKNEEYVEADVIHEKNINTPEYLDAEASANTEVNKDKDSVATDDLEGTDAD